MKTGLWSEQEDWRLAELKDEGLKFSAIGKLLGRSKSSCIGRFHRLNGTTFPAHAARREAAGARGEAARLARLAMLDSVRSAFRNDVERDVMIRSLVSRGVPPIIVAEACKLSRERIRVIAGNRRDAR